MASPREHIEEIRRTKFSIGKELNPLTEDLHQAVKIFSAELYAKDVHFLMELIQNAEDNDYAEGVDPSLEFVVTSRDITGTGASSTLLVFNNEKGFSPKNIDSICSVGRSTKKGNRKRGYIGEKGIGFKSVFLITSHPYIFSNGYQIRFNEEPCSDCNVGYIVPEWVEDNPILSNIQSLYGSGSTTTLPTTTMVLPLKPDKVNPVKMQLSSIHPEVLLFLSKIKQLSVKEDNEDPRLSTLSAIAISSETNFVTRKNIDAESYTLHLSTGENANQFDKECTYYMWRQKFHVKPENKVERRSEVEEWLITLAFPFNERLHRGTGTTTSPGVYAYLPTEMITNFPFVIQADFILVSSRETILFDSKWNQGILGCVPYAFINAFRSLVIESGNVPVFNLPNIFRFLPVESSSYPLLNVVRDAIKSMLLVENIVPCESYTDQNYFRKPSEVGRLMLAFWNILDKARNQGLNLQNLSSHGINILNSSFDKLEYDYVLNFLGIETVRNEWYAKCIVNSNLVLGLSEGVYLELLVFVAENWRSKFRDTNITRIPLLKYVDLNSHVSLCSINEANLFMSCKPSWISWLIDWNREFKCISGRFSLPKPTQEAISSCYINSVLLNWLMNDANVVAYEVSEYATEISNALKADRELTITYAHFLYHSFIMKYLTEQEVRNLCNRMALVDSYGRVMTRRSGVLVPANGSKWAGLIGYNPWTAGGYVELGEDYLQPGYFTSASKHSSKEVLIDFLKNYVGASDIPNLVPPDAAISTFSAPLTKKNAFLLLDWIRTLRCNQSCIPDQFLSCVMEGSWLKVSLNGSPSYKPPSQSFVSTSSWGNLLQNASVLVDIPLIDQGFYNYNILDHKEDLIKIGVRFEFGEACEYIGDRIMHIAASSALTKTNVFSILGFIRFLRSKMVPVDEFIKSIKNGRWVRTSGGDKSPVESVLYDQDWRAAAQISNVPFIEKDYYGDEIFSYKDELKLIGVVVGFNKNYKLVIDNLKFSAYINPSAPEVFILMLKCIRHSGSSDKFVRVLHDKKCLKTNVGFKSPSECFWFSPEWGCLLQVFDGCFPLIDTNFYGEGIVCCKNELKRIGVVVDFKDTVIRFASFFKQRVSASSVTKENVLLFLACCRKLKGTSYELPGEVQKCIREAKWLRTRLGHYRCPKECILFGQDWESISPICLLPFIDDSDKHYGQEIHEYKDELKSFGVIIDLKHGLNFVANSLRFPSNPTLIAPRNVLSLLECIRMLRTHWIDSAAPDDFLDKVSKKWLKTQFGYLTPNQALLFDEMWGGFLHRDDGPFIDEEFYGSSIRLYRKELCAIGVTIDELNGCALLANYIDAHSKFTTIVRIFNYLSKFNWKPEGGEASGKIWIPRGSDDGEWVLPKDCVLHDKDGLFSSQLNILDKCYDKQLLGYFSRSFEVKSNPSLDNYLNIWKDWESSGNGKLSRSDCHAFWRHVAKSWCSKTAKVLADDLAKLPTDSGLSSEVLLRNKNDVFLADDLMLRDLFSMSSPHPIFVWYPQPSSPALDRTKLLNIYREIGVRTISEAVQVEELSLTDGVELKKVNATESVLRKELFILILGFLSGPSIKMKSERRHKIVRRLINLIVFETAELILVTYSLALSSGEVVTVKASRMVRWDRENSKLFTQKIDRSEKINVIKFATYFAKIVSEGLLWDEKYIRDLSELIKLAFLVEFDEEAVEFLMKNKNLQVYEEDEEFLSSVFPSK